MTTLDQWLETKDEEKKGAYKRLQRAITLINNEYRREYIRWRNIHRLAAWIQRAQNNVR